MEASLKLRSAWNEVFTRLYQVYQCQNSGPRSEADESDSSGPLLKQLIALGLRPKNEIFSLLLDGIGLLFADMEKKEESLNESKVCFFPSPITEDKSSSFPVANQESESLFGDETQFEDSGVPSLNAGRYEASDNHIIISEQTDFEYEDDIMFQNSQLLDDFSFDEAITKFKKPSTVSNASVMAQDVWIDCNKKAAVMSHKEKLTPIKLKDQKSSSHIGGSRRKQRTPNRPKNEKREKPVSKSSSLELLNFDKIPAAKTIKPSFKYKEQRTRGKSARAKLTGHACQECNDYFEIVASHLNETEKDKIINKCSRHRFLNPPSYQNTPPGFWSTKVPPTQELYEKGYIKVSSQPFTPQKRKRRHSSEEDECDIL